MTIWIVGVGAGAVLFVAGLAAAALRSEHLIVLYWARRGTLLLERRPHGRYEPLSPWEVPGALARYLGAATATLLHPARVAEARAGRTRGVQAAPGA